MHNHASSDMLDDLSGIEFENLCSLLISKMGFDTQTTKASGDGGIDIVATSIEPLLRGRYIIQCKRYSGSVGEPAIRDLYGVVMAERANKGILITTGYFTKSALSFAEGKQLELINGTLLSELLVQHSLFQSTTSVAGNSVDNDDELPSDDDVTESIKEAVSYIRPFWNDILFEDLYEKWLIAENKSCVSSEIAYYLFKEVTDLDFYQSFSHPQRTLLLYAVRSFLSDLVSWSNKLTKSEMIQQGICIWLYAQTSFLLGDFGVARQLYSWVLAVWDDLRHSEEIENGLLELYYTFLLDMISFHAAIGEYDIAKNMWGKYDWLFEQKKNLLIQVDIPNAKNEHVKNHFLALLDDISNATSKPNFHLLTLLDYKTFFNTRECYDDFSQKYNTEQIALQSFSLYGIERDNENLHLKDSSGNICYTITIS